MPRLNTAAPKYRRHMKKYAVDRFGGKETYLGIHGSHASRAEYDRLISAMILNRSAVRLHTSHTGLALH